MHGTARPANGQPVQVSFDGGGRAALVEAGPGDDARGLVHALGLADMTGRPVILVCGGADELEGEARERAAGLVGPSVASAAALTDALVIDGGTAAGVMKLVGAARSERPGALPILVGVSPAGKVTYPGSEAASGAPLEPHHTHFVLADSAEWGGETQLLIAVVEALAADAPVVVILAGGGQVARSEALEAAIRRWPLFAIEGTGGAADEIAATFRAHREPKRRALAFQIPDREKPDGDLAVAPTADSPVRQIASRGDIRPFAGSESGQLARLLAWELQDEPVLKDAWRTFATYDRHAAYLRRTFERFQISILGLGVVATFLALLDNAIGNAALHWTVVAAPIVISVLIALANRKAAGKRWVLLRAAAESVKGEIYRYRTRTGLYADGRLRGGQAAGRPRVLAARLDDIEAGLMQTEASSGALAPYQGSLPPEMYGSARDDDGLSRLDAARYLEIRIGEQLSYYHGRTRELDRRRGVLQLLAVLAGGAGAILAAAGVEIWIGLTTAISGAALAYLAHLQIDNTIVAYNQSASKLARLQREWAALEPREQDGAALETLVTGGEAVLGTELGGWVQQMTQALDKLQATQGDAAPQADGEEQNRRAPKERNVGGQTDGA
jgi:SLOG in TRPM, prokaryote/SMODS and SLOG-associating 2TM effector domain 1/Protein of unknown function (DUF4231)